MSKTSHILVRRKAKDLLVPSLRVTVADGETGSGDVETMRKTRRDSEQRRSRESKLADSADACVESHRLFSVNR